MTDRRATMVLTGEVQDAGFRGKVMRIAQKLDLLGYIENLPNGTVRVVCEGPEEGINDFVGKLDIHDDDIDVEDVSVEWADATGEFKWFEVKFDNLGMEMFQGFATAGKKLSDVSKKVDGVGEKVEKNYEKLDKIADATVTTHEKLDRIADASVATHEKLDRIADASVTTHGKLDRIADASVTTHEKLDNINAATVTTHEKLGSIDHRLDDALTRYDLFGKEITVIREDIGDMKLLASEFREFKDLFAIYVKHQLDKDSE